MKPKHAHKLKIQGAAAYASRLDAEDHASPEVTARIMGLIETIRSEATSRVERILASQMLATCTGLRALGAAPPLFELGQDDAVIDEARAAACLVLNSIFHDENYRLDLDSINNYKDYNDFINVIGFREALTEPLKDSPSPPASDTERQTPAAARPKYLEALLATVPKDAPYEEQAQQLEGLSHELKRATAVRILPALKAEMEKRPHETHDDKKEIVKWVNGELRRLGLAIKHPKTGQAASLVVKPGNAPKIGTFQLKGEDDQGKEQTYTTPDLSTFLENLELIEAAPRREALREWHERVASPRRGASRA